MKLTTKQLKQIIKEELDIVLEGLEDVRTEDWIHVYNGCMGEGVPILGINAGDEDRCTDLAAQVQSGNYDYETVKAHLAYERNLKEPEEKDAIDFFSEENRKDRIKTEWDIMEPSMKQRAAEHYLNKTNAQFWKIREKIVEIRKEIRVFGIGKIDRDDLEWQIEQLDKIRQHSRQAEKYFENVKEGMRLNEPLPDTIIDWIYKSRYEKESDVSDFYPNLRSIWTF